MGRIFWQVFLLSVVIVILTEGMRLEAIFIAHERLFSESSYTEWVQSGFLLGIVLLLARESRQVAALSELGRCLFLSFLILLIRENDQTFELWFFHGIWKYIALVPALYLLAYFWSHRARIAEQVVLFSETAGYGSLLSGWLALIFSRMFGRSIYWQPVMKEDYQPLIKTAAQESVELLGYLLIMIGIVQFHQLSKSLAAKKQ